MGRFEAPTFVDHLKREEIGIGFDSSEGVRGNMMEAGIVDPTKITRSVLQNGASVAAMPDGGGMSV